MQLCYALWHTDVGSSMHPHVQCMISLEFILIYIIAAGSADCMIVTLIGTLIHRMHKCPFRHNHQVLSGWMRWINLSLFACTPLAFPEDPVFISCHGVRLPSLELVQICDAGFDIQYNYSIRQGWNTSEVIWMHKLMGFRPWNGIIAFVFLYAEDICLCTPHSLFNVIIQCSHLYFT